MDAVISALAELIVCGIPTCVYLAVRRGRGERSTGARTMGLTRGTAFGYMLAIPIFAITIALAYASVRGTGALPHGLHVNSGRIRTTGGLTATVGAASGPGGVLATAITTGAEEILFRGFLAGLLIGRLGFKIGNTLQALLFLAPHALLLAVAPALWPILPTQLLAGWLLGWLRYRCGSIGPGWLAHAAANIVAPLLLSG